MFIVYGVKAAICKMRDLHNDTFPTFSAIDIGVTQQEKIDILDEILDLPKEVHHWNEFRGCKMVSIYNGGGLLGGRETGSKRDGVFDFSAGGKMCPTLMRVCREKIFPFMSPPGRVTILKTAPGTGLNVHIDTTESEIGSLHQKYRLVLNGNVGKLYFIDRDYNKVYVPPYYDSYSMDGGHPHSIDPDEEEKITLCVGVPWHGASNEIYDRMMKNSAFQMAVSRPKILDEWQDPALK